MKGVRDFLCWKVYIFTCLYAFTIIFLFFIVEMFFRGKYDKYFLRKLYLLINTGPVVKVKDVTCQ